MKPVEGIEVRHKRSCPVKGWNPCKCQPSYQAHIWSRRDGKKLHKTFRTPGAAKNWRRNVEQALHQGTMRAPTPETVAAALDGLIQGMKDGTVRKKGGKTFKPSTIRGYTQSSDNHVKPYLGHIRFSELGFTDVQGFADCLMSQGF